VIRILVNHRVFTSEGEKVLQVDEHIEEGELICLTGPSGAGKTTLFNVMTGLVTPDTGLFAVGELVHLDTHQRINRTPQQRNVAHMFQDYALFPNMTVRENIVFAQKHKVASLVDRWLKIFDLELLASKKPNQLSGGQKQRVALARTLAQESLLVLLDEPLSAVDTRMKEIMKEEILSYRAKTGATVFVITHQPDEFVNDRTRTMVIA
jgi:molybdate transport system ATP-binding protein